MSARVAGMLVAACAAVASADSAGLSERAGRSPWSVQVAYYGEMLTHPGGSVGVERELGFVGPRFGIDRHGFFAGANLGGWWHARNAVGLFGDATLGYRVVFAGGLRLEVLGGLGYLHTFDAGTVFGVDAQGNAAPILDGGHPGLLMTGAAGLGWDLSVLTTLPASFYARCGAFGQYPYNGSVLPHLQCEVGVSIHLKGAS